MKYHELSEEAQEAAINNEIEYQLQCGDKISAKAAENNILKDEFNEDGTPLTLPYSKWGTDRCLNK